MMLMEYLFTLFIYIIHLHYTSMHYLSKMHIEYNFNLSKKSVTKSM